MKVAFYKGPTGIRGKLTRLWTWGPYSHCELIIDDTAFSSVVGVGTRFLLYPVFKPGYWDYVDIPIDKVENAHVWNWCHTEMFCPYDWKGIWLAQVLGLNRQDPDKWFCSEFCVAALKISGRLTKYKAHELSPNKLYKVLIYEGFRKVN